MRIPERVDVGEIGGAVLASLTDAMVKALVVVKMYFSRIEHEPHGANEAPTVDNASLADQVTDARLLAVTALAPRPCS